MSVGQWCSDRSSVLGLSYYVTVLCNCHMNWPGFETEPRSLRLWRAHQNKRSKSTYIHIHTYKRAYMSSGCCNNWVTRQHARCNNEKKINSHSFFNKCVLFQKFVTSRTVSPIRFAGHMLCQHCEMCIRYTAFREVDNLLWIWNVFCSIRHRTFRQTDNLLWIWNVCCSIRRGTFRQTDNLLWIWNVCCSIRHRTFRQTDNLLWIWNYVVQLGTGRFGRLIIYCEYEMSVVQLGTGRFGRLIIYCEYEMSVVQLGSGRFGKLIIYCEYEMSVVQLRTGCFGRLIIYCEYEMSVFQLGTGRFGRLIIYCEYGMSAVQLGTGRFGRLIIYCEYEMSVVQLGTGRFGRLIIYRACNLRIYWNLCIFIVLSMYSHCMFMYLHHAICHSSATLTDVFPCFFRSCKANARLKPAKTGHSLALFQKF